MAFTHIIHIADVHVRTNRGDEYIRVFDKLFKEIKRRTVTPLILICGDSMHDRPKHSAESIKLILYFLNGIAKLGKVVLINGNHDFYENNNERVKILEVLPKPEQIDYITKSGKYLYENVMISINTLDDKELIPYTEQPPEIHNVSMAHYTLTKQLLRAHAGYDITFLGDLHEHQIQENCYYSGSLIQQNFGETREKGFGIYDLSTKTYSLIQLPNDYAFITLSVDIHGELDTESARLPKNSRIRLRRPLQFQHRDLEYKQQLELLTNLLVYRVETVETIETSTRQQLQSQDLSDESVVEQLLDKNPLKDEIMKLHTEFKQTYNDERRQHQDTFFYLTKFTAEGVMSYKKKIKINFEALQGIIGIHGNNATGKSNLLRAIVFALCGDISVDYATITSTGQKGTSNKTAAQQKYSYDLHFILNNESQKGYTDIEFVYGDTKYRVIREITLLKDEKRKATVQLYKQTPAGWNSLTKTKRETDKDIYDMVGKSSLFMLINVYSRDTTSFVTCSARERYNCISNLIDLEAYESILKALDEEIKNLKTEVTALDSNANYILSSTKLDPKEQINIDTLMKEYHIIKSDILELESHYTPDIEPSETAGLISNTQALRKKLIELKTYNFPDSLSAIAVSEAKPTTLQLELLLDRFHQLKHIKKPDEITEDIPANLPEPYKTDVTLEQLQEVEKRLTNEIGNQTTYTRDELLMLLAKYNYNYKEGTIKEYNPNLPEFNPQDFIPLTRAEPTEKPKYEPISNIQTTKTEKELLKRLETTSQVKIQKTIKSLEKSVKPLKEIFSKKSIPKERITDLDNMLTNFVKRSNEITNIEDIEDKIEIFNELRTNIPEILRKLQIKADIEFNKQNEDNQSHNQEQKEIAEKLQHQKEQLNLLDELLTLQKKNYDNYQNDVNLLPHLDNFSYLLDQLNIKNYHKEIKYKYLQNVAYLVDQREKYNSLIEVVKCINYCKNNVTQNISEIENTLATTNTTVKITVNKKRIRLQEIDETIKRNKLLQDYRQIQEKLIETRHKLHTKQEYKTLIVQEGGIKDTFVMKYLKILESSINSTLSSYNIILASDKGNSISMMMRKHNRIMNLQQLSGYETFALEIATKRALNLLSTVGRSQLFIMDEGFDVIDSNNLEFFCLMLQNFKIAYKHILIISHDETIKSMVDHIISPSSVVSS